MPQWHTSTAQAARIAQFEPVALATVPQLPHWPHTIIFESVALATVPQLPHLPHTIIFESVALATVPQLPHITIFLTCGTCNTCHITIPGLVLKW